jgi:group I intron endonuclease
MEKIPGIYIIGDLNTGMSYVGSSSHLPKRLYEHERGLQRGDHKNWQLQKAFNDGNKLVVIPIATKSEENVLAIEQVLLDEYHSTGQLYNIMRDVAPTVVGIERTEETKKRIGEASARKFEDPEYRERHSEKLKEFYAIPENRERVRQNVIAAITTPEHREKMAGIANEQWADPEARARKSEEVKARYANNPEDRQNRIDARAHMRKPVEVNGVVYASASAVAEEFDITKAAVIGRIKSDKRPSWNYVDKEK